MTHSLTFFERFGYLGTCVLPAKCLDNTPLKDPVTGLIQTSLRKRCCDAGGLCYAHVVAAFAGAEGHYWADVAATPDLADAERVMLTEEDLAYALAWDKRLSWRTPLQIRRLMYAQARDLAPLCPPTEPVQETEPAPEAALFPVPEIPLTVVDTQVELTAAEIGEAFGIKVVDLPRNTSQRHNKKPLSVLAVQQGLLRALHRALQQRQVLALDQRTAQALQALSALVMRVQHWQQRTRQRVVNVVEGWDSWQRRTWSLMLGVPEALLMGGDVAAAI